MTILFSGSKKKNLTNLNGKPPHVANRGGVAYNKPRPPTSEKDPQKEEKLRAAEILFFQGYLTDNRADRLHAHRSRHKAAVGVFSLRG